jgi:hypothetical protein
MILRKSEAVSFIHARGEADQSSALTRCADG